MNPKTLQLLVAGTMLGRMHEAERRAMVITPPEDEEFDPATITPNPFTNPFSFLCYRARKVSSSKIRNDPNREKTAIEFMMRAQSKTERCPQGRIGDSAAPSYLGGYYQQALLLISTRPKWLGASRSTISKPVI